MQATPAPSPAETYDQYLGPAMFAPWGQLLLERAAPRAGEVALDLACGSGIVTRQLAPLLGEDGRLTGVDISEDMLAVARSYPAPQGAPIQWQAGDAGAIPANDGAFDLLVCQQGFQFFPDKAAAASEMRRVLADDGRAVISVWLGLERHAVFRALFEAESRHLDVPVARLGVPFSLSDADVLRELLEHAGFSRVEVAEHSMEVCFVDPDRFIELAVNAGAAVVPELSLDDPARRSALLDYVKQEAREVVEAHRCGNQLCFPMHANIAVAHA